MIRSGLAVTGVVGEAAKAARAVSRAARSWAACLGRIFGVDVSKCVKCGGVMRAVAVITEDVELDRILAHLGLEEDFPKTKPARSPPRWCGEDSQVDPGVEAWEGIDESVEV